MPVYALEQRRRASWSVRTALVFRLFRWVPWAHTLTFVWSAARSMWVEPAVSRPPTVSRHDWVLAAVVLVAVAVEVFGRPAAGWWTAALMSLGLVLAGAVLVRRAHPLAAVSLAFGAFLVVDMAALILGTEAVVLYSGVVVLALV